MTHLRPASFAFWHGTRALSFASPCTPESWPDVNGWKPRRAMQLVRCNRVWASQPWLPYHPPNMSSSDSNRAPRASKLEVVEPIGKRVLIRKDDDKKQTRAGIHLPDKIEIPTITGRIVAVSAQVDKDDDYPIKRYDRILFNPKHAIPVDLEGDNRLFVIPLEDIVAVFRREEESA